MKKSLLVVFSAELMALGADRVHRIDLGSEDVVLPHLVAGGSYWTTSVTLVNVYDKGDGTAKPFSLRFYDDDGNPWQVPFTGVGTTSEIHGELPFGGSVTYTTLAGGDQGVGWAELSYDWQEAAIAMWGTFKLSIAPVSEAVVPASKNDDRRFVIPFDSTVGYLGLGIANPDSIPVTANLTFTDSSGTVLYQTSLTLPGKGHTSFQLLDQYPNKGLEGRKGAMWVEVQSGGQGLAVLGLRFTPANTFTSIHPVYTYAVPEP